MISHQELPELALSVRQPWAWAIIHAGKDCENRGPMMIRHLPNPVREIAIHAAKGRTKDEYECGAAFMAELGVICPPAIELQRGGIIGKVRVTRVTKPSAPPQSRWYVGPRALMLADAAPCEFIPAVGALGYFRWQPADPSIAPAPAKWMLPDAPRQAPARKSFAQIDLEDLLTGPA